MCEGKKMWNNIINELMMENEWDVHQEIMMYLPLYDTHIYEWTIKNNKINNVLRVRIAFFPFVSCNNCCGSEWKIDLLYNLPKKK